MQFRSVNFIGLAFLQFFFERHKNGDNRKLKSCPFQLLKNYFCRDNERVKTLPSSILPSFYAPCVNFNIIVIYIIVIYSYIITSTLYTTIQKHFLSSVVFNTK